MGRRTAFEAGSALDALRRNMNEVYNIVDSSPFFDLPGGQPPHAERQKIEKVSAMLFTNKLIARKFAPAKLPAVSQLERLFNQYKHKDPSKFYPGLAAGIKRIAIQNGLNTAFLEHGFAKAKQQQPATSRKPPFAFAPQPVPKMRPIKLMKRKMPAFAALNFFTGRMGRVRK